MTTRLDDDTDACRQHDLAWAAVDLAMTLGLVLITVVARSPLMCCLAAVWFLVAVRQARLHLKARRP